MKSFNEFLLETKGEHDDSKLYDELYSRVEKYLSKWGAGPVYGWKSDKGIAFKVTKGKNIKSNDWITIFYNPRYDDFTITLCPFGTDDIEDARSYKTNVYAGQEHIIIDELLGLK